MRRDSSRPKTDSCFYKTTNRYQKVLRLLHEVHTANHTPETFSSTPASMPNQPAPQNLYGPVTRSGSSRKRPDIITPIHSLALFLVYFFVAYFISQHTVAVPEGGGCVLSRRSLHPPPSRHHMLAPGGRCVSDPSAVDLGPRARPCIIMCTIATIPNDRYPGRCSDASAANASVPISPLFMDSIVLYLITQCIIITCTFSDLPSIQKQHEYILRFADRQTKQFPFIKSTATPNNFTPIWSFGL